MEYIKTCLSDFVSREEPGCRPCSQLPGVRVSLGPRSLRSRHCLQDPVLTGEVPVGWRREKIRELGIESKSGCVSQKVMRLGCNCPKWDSLFKNKTEGKVWIHFYYFRHTHKKLWSLGFPQR